MPLPEEAIEITVELVEPTVAVPVWENLSILGSDGEATETQSAAGATGDVTRTMTQEFTDVVSVFLDATEYTEDTVNVWPASPDAGKYNSSATEQKIKWNVDTGDETKIPVLKSSLVEKARTYYSLSAVGAQFGIDSDTYKAAEVAFQQGVPSIVIIRAADTPDWDVVLTALEDENVQILCMANMEVKTANLTDLEKLITHCEGEKRICALMAEKAAAAATVTGYVTDVKSETVLYVAHKSDQDIAAASAAAMAIRKPWVTMFWKELFGVTTEYYPKADVATLETGLANVLIDVDGVVLSDGLTTFGGVYRFIDITRTRNYTARTALAALQELRRHVDRIPYDAGGLTTVEMTLIQAMQGLVDDGALETYVVTVPSIDQISDVDKTNRILRNVEISGKIKGEIHTFKVKLNLEI